MLVLTRKNQQSIRIGDIVVTVLAIDHGRAKIGISAPDNVRIQRLEIVDREDGSEECPSPASFDVTTV